MALEGILKKAVQHIRGGKLNNEAQVIQSVILPILRAMDWDYTDPDECKTEFPVDKGRVDYALIRPGGAPLVFIEAKALGRATPAGEDQVFRYAANKGVPFLILTDGDCWDFYLSMADGPPPDRRFYRAELTREERIPDYVEFFEEHLRKHHVISGDARRTAERRLESARERQKARAAIPGVWRALLEKPEEMLVDLLAEKVESQCGTKPEPSDIEAFLRGLRSDAPPPADLPRRTPAPRPPAPPAPDPPDPGPETKGRKNSKLTGFVLHGNSVETKTARNTLVEVLKAFQHTDPGFLERLALDPRTKSKSRRLVARKREELYANDHERCFTDSVPLENGWWVGTHASKAFIRGRIEIACEVAGVKFGSELRLIER